MAFQCDIKWLSYEQHGSWCMIKEWLWCNDMDNIDMAISSDCKMTGIWKTNWKLTTKWFSASQFGDMKISAFYVLLFNKFPSLLTFYGSQKRSCLHIRCVMGTIINTKSFIKQWHNWVITSKICIHYGSISIYMLTMAWIFLGYGNLPSLNIINFNTMLRNTMKTHF